MESPVDDDDDDVRRGACFTTRGAAKKDVLRETERGVDRKACSGLDANNNNNNNMPERKNRDELLRVVVIVVVFIIVLLIFSVITEKFFIAIVDVVGKDWDVMWIIHQATFSDGFSFFYSPPCAQQQSDHNKQ